MNAKAGEHRRSEPCGLRAKIGSVKDKNVASISLDHSRFFSAYTVLSHRSIMLPPRQPRVFARLARWQLKEAGTKVGPDQLGPPVRVGSTRINSDHLGSSRITIKNIKLNEIETFTSW